MDYSTRARLIDLNQDFYTRFGASFSATRHRLQPGVHRVLETLQGDESILDLGCGNGELARELAKRGHRGEYVGVDFSLPLLREAASQIEGMDGAPSARFMEIDLTRLSVISDQFSDRWSLVTAFAALHHIPGHELRLKLLKEVRKLLKPEGKFIHSNWQFLNSEKLKARIQPWEAATLSQSDVDAGDYLLDWRDGGVGLRYVHHFDENELATLAEAAGFRITNSFYSDGEGGRLSIYQIWEPDF